MSGGIILPDAELRMALGQHGINAVVQDDAPRGLVLRPELGTSDGDAWSSAAEAAEEVFRSAQTFMIAALGRPEPSGNLVILLPTDDAMGDPEGLAASILAGALISFVRTLALEFRKPGLSANCVFYDRGKDGVGNIAAIAGLIGMLTGQSGGGINGQEIFVSNGRDSGRRRP